MRSSTAAVTVLLWLCAGAVLPAQPALAEDGSGGGVTVTPGDHGGVFTAPTVDISVRTPGQAGTHHARHTASGGSGSDCTYSPAPDMESWIRRLPSRLPSPSVDKTDPNLHLYARTCNGQPVGYLWLGPGE